MGKDKLDTIACPYCGTQYLPAEIFIPSSFVGTPKNIEKDSVGKIVSFTGMSSDLVENYICDNCKTQFRVVAKISYSVSAKEKHNFNTEHTTLLHKAPVLLKED